MCHSMKSRVILFLKSYLFFVLIFLIQKPLFMLYHWNQASGVSFGDWLAVMWHGLPLDFSTAGYFSVLPGLLMVASCWVDKKIVVPILNVYAIIVLTIITLVFVVDIELYTYWGFRIDSTPLFYLSSPKDALASISVWMMIVGVFCVALCFAGVYWSYRRFVLKDVTALQPFAGRRIHQPLILFLLTALLFIPIRGGFSTATMNVGTVYFSNRLFLNHAAVNPVFNLMVSLTGETDFARQYRFMDETAAHKLFNGLKEQPIDTDSIPNLLTEQRPNIIFFVLESFMSKDIEALGGLPVAQNLSNLCNEGIVFTHIFANSFRTDRGLIANLSGYPAQPTTSIMKYPVKSQTLPSIQKSLKQAGYHTSYYYGGDADFTNMRSYLMSSGIEKLVSDKDFSLKERMSKWGAPDHILIRRLLSDLKQPQRQPFLAIVQTLSSHEPFEVPMHRFRNPYLNSVAYTDSCLGVFLTELRKSPLWRNTLLVFVPDHAMRFPETIENTDPDRYKIPIIWAGGVVKGPRKITRYGSQIDQAATLLYQLGIDHSAFAFSKNLLNPNSPEFGFFAFVDGFGFITPTKEVVYDHEQRKVVRGDEKSMEFQKGKAFLQCLYDDLAKR
jgi:phosphoglycerol transferase MdoB-like AlkP superfamily enzyme